MGMKKKQTANVVVAAVALLVVAAGVLAVGWMYTVNGWYPNYGCSSFTLSDGDYVEWRYTCSNGADIGG